MEIGFGSNVNLIFQTLEHAHYSPACAKGSHFITSERIINDENLSSKLLALIKFIREQGYDAVTGNVLVWCPTHSAAKTKLSTLF